MCKKDGSMTAEEIWMYLRYWILRYNFILLGVIIVLWLVLKSPCLLDIYTKMCIDKMACLHICFKILQEKIEEGSFNKYSRLKIGETQ